MYHRAMERLNQIQAELPAYHAAELRCETAIGRSPIPVVQNQVAAAEILSPVSACNDFVERFGQLQEQLRNANELQAATEKAFEREQLS